MLTNNRAALAILLMTIQNVTIKLDSLNKDLEIFIGSLKDIKDAGEEEIDKTIRDKAGVIHKKFEIYYNTFIQIEDELKKLCD